MRITVMPLPIIFIANWCATLLECDWPNGTMR
jgi:hypothetical protein